MAKKNDLEPNPHNIRGVTADDEIRREQENIQRETLRQQQEIERRNKEKKK